MPVRGRGESAAPSSRGRVDGAEGRTPARAAHEVGRREGLDEVEVERELLLAAEVAPREREEAARAARRRREREADAVGPHGLGPDGGLGEGLQGPRRRERELVLLEEGLELARRRGLLGVRVGDEEGADDLVGVEGRGLGDEELRRALTGVPAGASPRQ